MKCKLKAKKHSQVAKHENVTKCKKRAKIINTQTDITYNLR